MGGQVDQIMHSCSAREEGYGITDGCVISVCLAGVVCAKELIEREMGQLVMV